MTAKSDTEARLTPDQPRSACRMIYEAFCDCGARRKFRWWRAEARWNQWLANHALKHGGKA